MAKSNVIPPAFQRETPIALHEILSGSLIDELHGLFYHIDLRIMSLSGEFELFSAPLRLFDDLRYMQCMLLQSYKVISKAPFAAYKILPFRRRVTELLSLLWKLGYLIGLTGYSVVNLRPRQFYVEVKDVFFIFWNDIEKGFGPLREVLEGVTHMYVLMWNDLLFKEWEVVEKVWESFVRASKGFGVRVPSG